MVAKIIAVILLVLLLIAGTVVIAIVTAAFIFVHTKGGEINVDINIKNNQNGEEEQTQEDV